MVELVPYSKKWILEFEQLRNKISEAAGQHALSVEHIGSTAIPGMMAKDIIDVQVAVGSLGDLEIVAKALEASGFEYLSFITHDHAPGHEFGDYLPGFEKRFLKAPASLRPANIHLRLVDAKNYDLAILFRDYLRANADAARAYQQVKSRLAEGFPHDLKAYSLAKDPVCDLIFMLAEKWRDELP